MNKIGFPGLGLEFDINPTAFSIFGLDIQWYGIILSVGIVCAFLLFYRNAVKKELIDGDTVLNATLLIVPISIVGARFAYVVTSWEHFKDKSFFDIINIRAGGIAIYGAIIFGLLTVLIYNKIKKTSSLAMLDALAPAVMLGQVIGRWGNFVNAEAYGWTESGLENLPWRMWIDVVRVDGRVLAGEHLVHPTFIYESLWNLLGLCLIMLFLYRKKKFNGEIFCAYTVWYGLGRAFIESIRADSLYIINTEALKIKFSVAVGVGAFVGGIILAIVLYKRAKAESERIASYVPAYASAKTTAEKEEFLNEEPEEDDAETLAEQDLLDNDISDTEK